MIHWEKSGYIVETKKGKIGRTFNNKGLVNGKVPVYLATLLKEKKLPKGDSVTVPLAYSDKAILCDPGTLKKIGLID